MKSRQELSDALPIAFAREPHHAGMAYIMDPTFMALATRSLFRLWVVKGSKTKMDEAQALST